MAAVILLVTDGIREKTKLFFMVLGVPQGFLTHLGIAEPYCNATGI